MFSKKRQKWVVSDGRTGGNDSRRIGQGGYYNQNILYKYIVFKKRKIENYMPNYKRMSSLLLHHRSVQEMDFVSQWKHGHKIRILVNSEVLFVPTHSIC